MTNSLMSYKLKLKYSILSVKKSDNIMKISRCMHLLIYTKTIKKGKYLQFTSFICKNEKERTFLAYRLTRFRCFSRVIWPVYGTYWTSGLSCLFTFLYRTLGVTRFLSEILIHSNQFPNKKFVKS